MKKVQALLNDEEKATIAQAVKQAEENTACEIIPVLTASASMYKHASYFIGFIFALVAFCIEEMIYPLQPITTGWSGNSNGIEHLVISLGVMIIAFIVGAALSQLLPWLKLPFISREEMTEKVRLKAFEAYMQFSRGKTKANTGIVILVSLFEHIVYVQGDTAVNAYFNQQDWESIKETMIQELKKKQIALAFSQGVRITGDIVQQKLPKVDDENECSNELQFL